MNVWSIHVFLPSIYYPETVWEIGLFETENELLRAIKIDLKVSKGLRDSNYKKKIVDCSKLHTVGHPVEISIWKLLLSHNWVSKLESLSLKKWGKSLIWPP